MQPSGKSQFGCRALAPLIACFNSYRDHYCNNYEEFTDVPKVGDFCCAQFSEDECWYRAKVVDVMEEDSLQLGTY